MAINIEDPNDNKSPNSFSLFALGFRPFFLLAGLSAVILLFFWVSRYSLFSLFSSASYFNFSVYSSYTIWHAHEMLFGYAIAVIAGFLLTAAGNWTGTKIISGYKLVLLVLIWLLGRIFPFVTDLPFWLVSTVDMVFIPILMLLIAIPIIRVKQWNNLIFVPILFLMFLANCLIHLSAMKVIDIPELTGIRSMFYLVILLIVLMGGRVIPFFTEKGVSGITIKKRKLIETLSLPSIIIFAISDVVLGNTIITSCFALLACVVHVARLSCWYSNKIWNVPLVWVLHTAYAWIIVGLIYKFLNIINLDNAGLLSTHAFTAGGIGIMTLGMMSRVSLGHTGRELLLNSWMILAFILINLSVVVRVVAPLFLSHAYYINLIQFSGLLWYVSFTIFVIVYIPVWLKPRVDGRPG